MKFALSALSSALFVGSALSQSISIAFPKEGTAVTAGSDITVEIDQPSFTSSLTQIALVLAIAFCDDGICTPPTDVLGPVVFSGPYNPQHHPTDPPSKPPNQNFTVTVPDFSGPGTLQLSAFYIALIGAVNEPFTAFRNITLALE